MNPPSVYELQEIWTSGMDSTSLMVHVLPARFCVFHRASLCDHIHVRGSPWQPGQTGSSSWGTSPEHQRHSAFMGTLVGSSTYTTILFSGLETGLDVPSMWNAECQKKKKKNPPERGLWVILVKVCFIADGAETPDWHDDWQHRQVKHVLSESSSVLCARKLKLRGGYGSRRVKDQDAPSWSSQSDLSLTSVLWHHGNLLATLSHHAGTKWVRGFCTSLWSPYQLDGVHAVIRAKGGNPKYYDFSLNLWLKLLKLLLSLQLPSRPPVCEAAVFLFFKRFSFLGPFRGVSWTGSVGITSCSRFHHCQNGRVVLSTCRHDALFSPLPWWKWTGMPENVFFLNILLEYRAI